MVGRGLRKGGGGSADSTAPYPVADARPGPVDPAQLPATPVRRADDGELLAVRGTARRRSMGGAGRVRRRHRHRRHGRGGPGARRAGRAGLAVLALVLTVRAPATSGRSSSSRRRGPDARSCVDGPYALRWRSRPFEIRSDDLAAGVEMTPDAHRRRAGPVRLAPLLAGDANGPEPSRDDDPGPPRAPRRSHVARGRRRIPQTGSVAMSPSMTSRSAGSAIVARAAIALAFQSAAAPGSPATAEARAIDS